MNKKIVIIKAVKNDYWELLLYRNLFEIIRLLSIIAAICIYMNVIFLITTSFDPQIIILFNTFFYIFIFSIFLTTIIYLPFFINKVIKFNKLINDHSLLKNKFINSLLVNVYYLSILKASNLLTDEEFNMKRNHLLGKRHFSAENFYLLARYKDYLEINAIDFANKKQEFLHNNDQISIVELRRLIKNGFISTEEAKIKKLDYTHYSFIFIFIYLVVGSFIIL